ncbi:MAG: type 2 lanthipeptide synthetase LanM family protein [Edaphobacter sp.]
MFLDEDLRQLAARSMSLYERVGGAPSCVHLAESVFQAKLDVWRRQAADGDEEIFCRRLKADGLSPSDLPSIMGDHAFTLPELPEWCLFLEEALSDVSEWTDADVFSVFGESTNQPFHSLARPFLQAAERRLRMRLSGAEVLAGSAIADAVDYLARCLCPKSASAHHLEFVIFRASRENRLAGILRQARKERSDNLYRQFVRSFYDGKWRSFFLEYAVLGRQLSMIALQWVETVSLLAERLSIAEASITSQFNASLKPGPVTSLKLGLSDSHNGGHTTSLLTFQSGLRLVYKPKPLATDNLIAGLIHWLNSKDGVQPMKSPVTLDCGTHGWQDFIGHAPCTSEAGIRSFYIRMGQLLGLTYALEAYDYHHENLIAHGDQPYLVDTETIFNPYKEVEAISSKHADAAVLATTTIYYSVLRTGLLPSWTIAENGGKRDTSGLGGGNVEGSDLERVKVWRSVNSDDMRLEFTERPIRALPNHPFVEDGTAVSAGHYVAEIRNGFACVYSVFLAHQKELLGLMENWPATEVRFVRRPTNLYASLLRELSEPEHLRDGMDWSIQLDIQSRQLLAANSKNPEEWRFLREESAALMQGDIPYFKVGTHSRDIFNGKSESIVRRYLDMNCMTRLYNKLELLNSRDQNLQDRYIVYTFYARAARNIHDETSSESVPLATKASTSHLSPISPRSLEAIALEIAAELMEEPVRGEDGSVSWIALEYLQKAGVFQFKPISFNLYSGALGVAYFFAALARITGAQSHRQYALAALAPVLRIAQREAREVLRFSGLGVGVGLGSLIYGLASIADLLGPCGDSDACLEASMNCIPFITEKVLREDSNPDLMFGTAGGILALAKLRKVTRYPEVGDKIAEMAQSLLAKQQRMESGKNVVPTYEGRAVTGLSHGVAGVALSLARAYEAVGDDRFLDAAFEHVEFEESLYDATRGIYPDYRSREGKPAYMTNWCHGAPGIGLTRLAIYGITQDDSLIPQIKKNMEMTSRFPLDRLDHLCCGNLGRLDIQLEYAIRMQNSTLESIQKDTAFVVQRYYANGGFRFFVDTPSKVFCPGLFSGAAGIGYALLRLSNPGTLPCVLALD